MADPADRYLEVDEAAARRLKEAVTDRMAAIGINSQADLVRHTGVAAPLIRSLLSGEAGRYWRSKIRDVSFRIGWTADSGEAIVAGKPPTIRSMDPDVEARFNRLEARLADLVNLVEKQLGKSGDGA